MASESPTPQPERPAHDRPTEATPVIPPEQPAETTQSAAKQAQPAAKQAQPAAKQATRPATKSTRPAKKAAQPAQRTAAAARRAAAEADLTAEHAERTLRNLMTESAYAAVGVGDTAIGVLRSVPGEVDRVRKDAPKRVRSLLSPDELQERLEGLRKEAEEEFDTYARRGRSVADAVRHNEATSRAFARVKAARIQVKAAATSVRSAFGESAHAAQVAADKVGEEPPKR